MRYIFIVLGFFLFLGACRSPEPKELLAKKWVFDQEYFNKKFEKLKKENPEEAHERESTFENVKSTLASVSYDFKPDGTYQVQSLGQTQKGKWKVSEDAKTLILTEDGENENKYVIKELTKNKFILEQGEEDLVFIPAS